LNPSLDRLAGCGIEGQERSLAPIDEGRIMEMQDDLKRAYEKSINFSWAMIAALVLCTIAVEIVRMSNPSFSGIAQQTASQVRDIIYGIAIISPLGIGVLRKAILKHSRLSDVNALLNKLATVAILTMLVAEIPAVLGLLLFLLGGLYKEFYISLGYSALVILAYFPRANQWERWLISGVVN
jgi:hypothetical protein